MERTHICGQLRKENIGETVTLNGWVATYRDHGGVIFVDLRDRSGLTQLVFSPERDVNLLKLAESLRPEDVIEVDGKVSPRPEGTVNTNLDTGDIEVEVSRMDILNRSKTPPFEVRDDLKVGEETRLRYRYIDLRRPSMQKAMMLRHRVSKLMRDYFDGQGFLEIETPYLTKSTPEGARDFLVPCRMNPGSFYALPQSPQLFKQLFMVAGFDRYFQIVRCFRDEDLRANRQPEFTQLDLEMSFVKESDIFELVDGLFAELFREILSVEIATPFPRLTYHDAMERFGSDSPDLRFGMELVELAEVAQETDFRVFKNVLDKGGRVKGICVPGGAALSRKELDDLTARMIDYGAKGLAWVKVEGGKLKSPIAKFFNEKASVRLIEKMSASDGDVVFMVADVQTVVFAALGALRGIMAERYDLIDNGEFKPLWVVDFPLFERNPETNHPDAMHHPFTSPRPEDVQYLDDDPCRVLARAYDIVLNGQELGSGSIRIHSTELQEKIFSILGISREEAQEKFGFLLEALCFGAPPHAGIALGLDRLIMILAGLDSIRDVIAFPKTQKGMCLLTGAPTEVTGTQLKELGLRQT